MTDEDLDEWLEKRIEEIKATNFGRNMSEEHKRKIGDANRGNVFSEQSRLNMSLGQIGKKCPPRSSESRERSRQTQLKKREHYRQTSLKQWSDPAMREKMVKAILASSHIRPTTAEIRLGKFIEQACPGEYKYTGDGSIIIGGLIPDFTNINGQKKVIEVFGNYWHSKKIVGRNQQEEEERKITKYRVFGFKCLIIWERELNNPEKIAQRVTSFNHVT